MLLSLLLFPEEFCLVMVFYCFCEVTSDYSNKAYHDYYYCHLLDHIAYTTTPFTV
jgi:hypothetical protein